MKRILALTAHPDDEVNCAGIMIKNKNAGGQNMVVCFTGNSTRKLELQESCKILGAKAVCLNFEEFKIRMSTALLEKLKELIIEFKPNIIVVQANDYHPDHKIVFEIAIDAIEFASHNIDGWFCKNILEMEATGLIKYPDVIYNISEEYEQKRLAFEVHNSQVQGKSFGNYYLEMVEAKARLRGVLIGAKYAEAFKLHWPSIKGNFYPKSRGIQNIEEEFQ